jgi:hypothetical protein
VQNIKARPDVLGNAQYESKRVNQKNRI